MQLILERYYSTRRYTEGRLYEKIGGKRVFICDTLEPSYLAKSRLAAGNYFCTANYSEIYHKWIVTLISPSNDGAMFYWGNTCDDFRNGCILLGQRHSAGVLVNSRFHHDRMVVLVREASAMHSVPLEIRRITN